MDRMREPWQDSKIREMQFGDLDQIMEIEKVSFPTPWSRNMFIKELKGFLSRSFVAVRETKQGTALLGYINYWIFADEVHLNNLAVKAEYRGKGIAHRLLVDMTGRAREEGVRWGTLEVRRSNEAALRLYEKVGYSLKGVRPNYYDDTKEDALIMWMDLTEERRG